MVSSRSLEASSRRRNPRLLNKLTAYLSLSLSLSLSLYFFIYNSLTLSAFSFYVHLCTRLYFSPFT
jgi:hypothetical protein